MTIPDFSRLPEPDSGRRPTLVVVSGRPGSGKSTLARGLADALSCPMVSRDEINEGIFRTLGRGPEPADKDQVAKLTFDAFFRVLTLLVSYDVTFVAEAAFQDLRWRIGLEPLLPMADVKVIHCTIDPEFARERVIRRRLERRDARRREQAPAGTQTVEPGLATVRPFEPLSLPVPSLTVSTIDGYDPRLEEITAFVQSG
ncbi:MAG: AAA family ATPase [Pseudonocardiaceae bacterium]